MGISTSALVLGDACLRKQRAAVGGAQRGGQRAPVRLRPRSLGMSRVRRMGCSTALGYASGAVRFSAAVPPCPLGLDPRTDAAREQAHHHADAHGHRAGGRIGAHHREGGVVGGGQTADPRLDAPHEDVAGEDA